MVASMTDEKDPIVHVVADRVRIAITGDDRTKWLNGMVTCDVTPLASASTPRATYGCILNVKGKVLADAIIVADEGRLGAWVPQRTAASVLELWNKYIIMEDCEVALDVAHALVSVQGKRAESSIASLADEAFVTHAAPLDELGIGGGVVLDVPREELDGVVSRIEKAGAARIDEREVQRRRIAAARPAFGIDLDEHNYVQEAGLQGRAVSFNKGCYVGQEVVCMLEMRGKVHRRLVQVTLPAGTSIEKGTEVRAGDDVVGNVTSVGTGLALAMVKTSSSEPGTCLTIGETKGEVVGPAS
jgi:folate-binding protein YgfZ